MSFQCLRQFFPPKLTAQSHNSVNLFQHKFPANFLRQIRSISGPYFRLISSDLMRHAQVTVCSDGRLAVELVCGVSMLASPRRCV